MADETRTPEGVVNDFLGAYAAENGDKVWLRVSAGDDLRNRLAALIREERMLAFMAGMRTEAQRSLTQDLDGRVAAEEVYKTARRLAVEGRSDG